MPVPELQIAPANSETLMVGPDIAMNSEGMRAYELRIGQLVAHYTGKAKGGLSELETADLAAEYHAGKKAAVQIPPVMEELSDTAQMHPDARAELLNKWRSLTQASHAGNLAGRKIIEANLPLAYFFARESLGMAHEVNRLLRGKGGSGPKKAGYFGPLIGLLLPGGEIDDRMGNATYGMLKALGRWNSTINSNFGGYAGNDMHNELIRGIGSRTIMEYDGPRVPERVIVEYLATRRKYGTANLYEAAEALVLTRAERERLRDLQRHHEMRFAYFLEDLRFSPDVIKEEIDEWSFTGDPWLLSADSDQLAAPVSLPDEEEALTEDERIEEAWVVQDIDIAPQLADVLADPNMSVEEEARYRILRERIDRLLPIVLWRGYAAAAQKRIDAPQRLARDVTAMRLRFGLDDGEPKSRNEVAKLLGINPDTVRNAEIGMIDRLRRPPYVDRLQGFL